MCAWAQRDGADNFALIFTLLQYRDEALTDALTERDSDHGLTVLGRAVAWGHESTVKLVAAACRCPCARPTASTQFSVRAFVAHLSTVCMHVLHALRHLQSDLASRDCIEEYCMHVRQIPCQTCTQVQERDLFLLCI